MIYKSVAWILEFNSVLLFEKIFLLKNNFERTDPLDKKLIPIFLLLEIILLDKNKSAPGAAPPVVAYIPYSLERIKFFKK